MTRTHATFIGFSAVALWSLLALFTVGSAPVPPFLLNALTFAIGGMIGLIWVARSGGLGQLRAISWRVYAFGTAGLFGYHALYFSALRMAPAAEAGLIAYLWPLLIVLFSGLLPGERLRPLHLIGAALAFAGAALIVSGGGTGPSAAALPGYGLAFLCALTWAAYSLISRRLGAVPTAAVAVYCLATAALSALAHVAWEDTLWPAGALGWGAVLALGLGPVGLAFYTWDVGVKRGDIQLLGTASYAAPLLSTLALILGGVAEASTGLALAAALIASGALLAARASRE
ncbi:EamA family transporter [Rhodobacter veldkampii DSM 11550]|uniref:EamA family transporter n=1 Tax=Phaeovulum veldkampii DSM 11550 TaxID=1185920 RepID=A0A2T4JGZ0_9RHOB|nr:EamA family transporter [Phaeovulum veldkampii]MBK5945247.1 EamA family transporter [Phaeovulum veldkampii DSM 11550]PTE17180.1 EamA family transporter [Phaeovulum veldkampii DSM 11550]TDQ61435.1 EamA domain-containing membrane protein RarD [Phaeovulum veldkampii DSM 11550]